MRERGGEPKRSLYKRSSRGATRGGPRVAQEDPKRSTRVQFQLGHKVGQLDRQELENQGKPITINEHRSGLIIIGQ